MKAPRKRGAICRKVWYHETCNVRQQVRFFPEDRRRAHFQNSDAVAFFAAEGQYGTTRQRTQNGSRFRRGVRRFRIPVRHGGQRTVRPGTTPPPRIPPPHRTLPAGHGTGSGSAGGKKHRIPLWGKILIGIVCVLVVLIGAAALYINGKLDLIHYDDGSVDSVGTIDADEDQDLDGALVGVAPARWSCRKAARLRTPTC